MAAAIKDTLACAPDKIPAAYEASICALEPDTKDLLIRTQVPYFIMHQLSEDGYKSLAFFADRWVTKEKCLENAAKDYNFEAGKNDYDAKSSLLTGIKLGQAISNAKQIAERLAKQLNQACTTTAAVALIGGQRSALEAHYANNNKGERPDLESQGSDHYLGLQYKYCSKGEIGYFTNKQIISYLPERGEAVSKAKRSRKDEDGVTHDYDEEERQDPRDMEAWKRQMAVFCTSLLMCIWAFPQWANLQITKSELDDYYKFIYGQDIAQRHPAPSLSVLMIAERNSWREIAKKLHKGSTLAQALKDMQAANLFWTREVYERVRPNGREQAATGADWNQNTPRGTRGGRTRGLSTTPNRPTKGTKGQGKTASWETPPPKYEPLQTKGAKDGKGTKGAKGKTKGDGKAPKWPSTWATKDADGTEYCRKKLLENNCPGNCGRSHNCPNYTPAGEICNGKHNPWKCWYHKH
jgi:hypothetical protein